MTESSAFAERYGPWAIVAGASEGVGRELARKVAANGVNCILIARREGPLAELAELIRAESGVECIPASIDLAAPDAFDRILATVGSREVGLYISNAGADPNGSHFLDRKIETWVELVHRNVLTTIRCLPPLRRPDARTTSRWAAARGLGRGLWWSAVHGGLLGCEGVRPALRRVPLGRAAPLRRRRACRSCSSRRTRRRCADFLQTRASRCRPGWLPRPTSPRSVWRGCRWARSTAGGRSPGFARAGVRTRVRVVSALSKKVFGPDRSERSGR